MFRNLASVLSVLFVFALAVPETPAQQVSGVTGYTYNTTYPGTGQPLIGLHVDFNDIAYFDSIAIFTYFQCGEDSPTPADPGTYVGGGEGLLGPATYTLPIDLMDGRTHAPFQGCTHGWYSVEFFVDGISYWYFFEWSEDL